MAECPAAVPEPRGWSHLKGSTMATLYKQFLFDGFLAPEKSWWYQWNNISGVDALYFYAVPKIGQNSFPQTIEIQEVRIRTTQSANWVARMLIYNSTPPANIAQQDGCFFSVYMVGVSA
jgi:hypothetical protein